MCEKAKLYYIVLYCTVLSTLHQRRGRRHVNCAHSRRRRRSVGARDRHSNTTNIVIPTSISIALVIDAHTPRVATNLLLVPHTRHSTRSHNAWFRRMFCIELIIAEAFISVLGYGVGEVSGGAVVDTTFNCHGVVICPGACHGAVGYNIYAAADVFPPFRLGEVNVVG